MLTYWAKDRLKRRTNGNRQSIKGLKDFMEGWNDCANYEKYGIKKKMGGISLLSR